MLITKSIRKFIVFRDDTILDALHKINESKCGITFVLDYNGVLEGVITDGDFRRYLMNQQNLDLNTPVLKIMNTNYISYSVEDAQYVIGKDFTSGLEVIPLIEKSGRLVAVAIRSAEGIQIGEFQISEEQPAFIIAEVGNNHNGSIKLAKQLVDLAIDAGADCVKFQMRNMEALYKNGGSSDDNSADLGTQYTLDLLNRFQLTDNELLEVFDYCKQQGIMPLCTPWDLESLRVLEEYGMEAYKIASADLTNHELLEAVASTGKHLICSTGMSTEAEIKNSVGFLRKLGTQFVMLHCNSTYPTPFRDINLRYINRLKEISGSIVGYSGHERGSMIPVVAVSMGAKIVEKHFTIDKTMEGNDHKVSLLPEEFKDMVIQIRQLEEAMGNNNERTISQGETINREVLAKSLVINRELDEGEFITRDMIDIKSPGQGLKPYYVDQLVGKVAQRDFSVGDYFYESDLLEKKIIPRHYSFRRPFGIPARYHDYNKLCKDTNLDFVEFHLSYQDMKLEPSEFISGKQSIGFVVHSPELFAGDHIMDLCSEKEEYRKQSISELQDIVAVTRRLKQCFPDTVKPLIIVNAGGFSKTGFLQKEECEKKYELIAASLGRVDQEGVEIIIQTMPPFPWHFGGQSYHNLFVDPDEIADFCGKYNYRICLDVSHSQMACNYYKWSLIGFVEKVAKYTAHMHIVDAEGVDGEGVQIGEGDVNFDQLGKTLNKYAENISFIPEVWQGHKQHGAGFWQALDYLEKFL